MGWKNCGHLSTYEDGIQEYRLAVEPYLTDEKIKEVLEEMRNYPKYFPASSIIDEVTGKQEATASSIEVVSEERDVDFDDDWI
ncbi:MAG: hypothetical protein J6C46_06770 [Clostridia bacterium]|nr:hypothetical protein [Clostridia bacterium]